MKIIRILMAWFLSLTSLSLASAADKVDFNKQVLPILQKSCIQCHGAEKQKAGLRLDNREAALKGGKHGVVFVAGNPEKSPLYRRLTLPVDDDDVMPPKGKADPLAKPQIELIKNWIEQGAIWP